MTKGYYKSRYELIKNPIEVHFFEPDVLDKYKNNPYYVLEETSFYTKYDAPKNIKQVGLQQYLWGKKKNGAPCIAVLLFHISRFNLKEQMYWRSFELSSKESKLAKIEERFGNPTIYGKFSDTISSFSVIIPTLKFINQIVSPNTLFKKVPEKNPSFLHPMTKNSKKELLSYIHELDKILSANINVDFLYNNIISLEKEELKNRGETLNLLWLWLKEIFSTLGVSDNEIDECLEPLRIIRKERQELAHKIFEDDANADYILKQKQITLKTWKALGQISCWLKLTFDKNEKIKWPYLFSDCRII